MEIAYDDLLSTNSNPRYFVYDPNYDNEPIYKGTYAQCLCVVGYLSLDIRNTLTGIEQATDGFITINK